MVSRTRKKPEGLHPTALRPGNSDGRIKVRQIRSGHSIIEFSVQYNALIADRWYKLVRFDNAHGKPHRHVYYPNMREYRQPMTSANNNDAFTDAQSVIKKNFIEIRENYIILMERIGD